MKRIGIILAVIGLALGLSACDPTTTDAENVNKNLATDADNFKVARKVTFYNGITDKVMLTIQGLCSVDAGNPARISVVCKTGKNGKGEDEFVRNFLGRSDNTTYLVEQLEATNTSTSAYRIVLNPEAMIPEIGLK